MADDNKNPLDVLEELLVETKNSDVGSGATNSGSKSAGSSSANDANSMKQPKKTEEELAAELKKTREEFEQKQKEQNVVDEKKLLAQKQAILSIKDSNEYKARVSQDTEKKTNSEKKIIAGEGFKIDQLGHKKV